MIRSKNTRNIRVVIPAVALAVTIFFHAGDLLAQGYSVSNLVSDLPGQAANTDTNLINAWGLALLPDNSMVVNINENDVAGLYTQGGQLDGGYLEVDSAPTGLIVNRGGFMVSDGGKPQSSTLIFVTEAGMILGWSEKLTNSTAAAVVAVDNSEFDAVYKGVTRLGNRLYAADFKGGLIDVYDSKWNWLGAFTDAHVDPGFGPFNVAAIDGQLYVTFAKRLAPDFKDDEPGDGNGFVDVFNGNGQLVRRLISHGPLDSPWGIAKAPANFGKFSNALLVGNFGDGTINAFNIKTGQSLGTLTNSVGSTITIPGLWALEFGTTKVPTGMGGMGKKTVPTLFFTAGPNGESDGLVGRINAN